MTNNRNIIRRAYLMTNIIDAFYYAYLMTNNRNIIRSAYLMTNNIDAFLLRRSND
jgi:hypothetical protein